MFIPFYKYQASGNDFVIINQYDQAILEEFGQEEIEKMCHRRFGIGADGLMLIQPCNAASFYMNYYNSDGRPSSMCGNGGRCIAHLAHKLGIIPSDARFEAVDGLHDVKIRTDNQVSLKMNDVDAFHRESDAFVLDTGSPHFVRFSEDIHLLDVRTEGRAIRYSERFKESGINVNFAESRQDALHVRTYERGVEDETWSCGTGVTAAALSQTLIRNLPEGQYHTDIQTPGGKLHVTHKYTGGQFKDIWLTGPAVLVFEGTLNTDQIVKS